MNDVDKSIQNIVSKIQNAINEEYAINPLLKTIDRDTLLEQTVSKLIESMECCPGSHIIRILDYINTIFKDNDNNASIFNSVSLEEYKKILYTASAFITSPYSTMYELYVSFLLLGDRYSKLNIHRSSSDKDTDTKQSILKSILSEMSIEDINFSLQIVTDYYEKELKQLPVNSNIQKKYKNMVMNLYMVKNKFTML